MEFVLKVCVHCGLSNRLPIARSADRARCGSCKTALPASVSSLRGGSLRRLARVLVPIALAVLLVGAALAAWAASRPPSKPVQLSCEDMFQRACQQLKDDGDLAASARCFAWASGKSYAEIGRVGPNDKELTNRIDRNTVGQELRRKVRDRFGDRPGFEGFRDCYETHGRRIKEGTLPQPPDAAPAPAAEPEAVEGSPTTIPTAPPPESPRQVISGPAPKELAVSDDESDRDIEALAARLGFTARDIKAMQARSKRGHCLCRYLSTTLPPTSCGDPRCGRVVPDNDHKD